MIFDVIMRFNNVENPYFVIEVVQNEGVTLGEMMIDSSNLVDGLIYDIDSFANKINDYLNKFQIEKNNLLFLLNCGEFYKTTHILPKINERKSDRLFMSELEKEYPDLYDYDRISYEHQTQNGKVYYNYFVSNKILKFFSNLNSKIGFKNCYYDTYANYLYNNLDNAYRSSCAYFYKDYGVTHLLTIIDDDLVSYASFKDEEKNYNLFIASHVINHSYELEKKVINTFVVNSDISYLNRYKPIVFDFRMFRFNYDDGKKI